MAGIDAPFLTPDQLGINTAGNPALAGVQQNFDPANKTPLQGLQDTFTRLDTENNAAQQQKQQQSRQFDHDLLTKHMEYDHEEKMQKAANALKDRNDLFNMLSTSGGTSATLKDGQGNDMSIPFLPADQDQLNQATNDFNKKVIADPTGYKTNPEAWQQFNDLKQTRTNASMRSIYTAQAKQQLAQTFDPAEKQRLQDYIDKVQSSPLDSKAPPLPYIQEPTVQPMVDPSKYKDKDLASFDAGDGIPNAPYVGLLNTNDHHQINEGFKRYQFFQAQPQGQSADAYQKYVNDLNTLTDQRGLPRINLGGTPTQDGKVVFDDGTYQKKQQLAKNYLAASELMNNGYLKPSDDKEAAQTDKLKAEAREATAKATLAERELKTGKPVKQTKEDLVEEQNKKAVTSTYNEVSGVYKDAFSKPTITVPYPSFYTKNGINPDEYKIYPELPIGVADKYIGLPAPETDITQKDGTGNSMITKNTGGSIKPDHIVPIENKKTGEKELAYWKDGVVKARVPEKQAMINKIKHETNYDEKLYGQQTPYVDEVYGKGGKVEDATTASYSASKTTNSTPKSTPITLPKVDQKIMEGGKKIAIVDGKKYEITGKTKSGQYIGQPL